MIMLLITSVICDTNCQCEIIDLFRSLQIFSVKALEVEYYCMKKCYCDFDTIALKIESIEEGLIGSAEVSGA